MLSSFSQQAAVCVWGCMTHFLGSVYCCCSNQPSMALSENAGKPRVTGLGFFSVSLFLKDGRQAKANLFVSYPLCWPPTAYSWVVLLCFGIQSNIILLFFVCVFMLLFCVSSRRMKARKTWMLMRKSLGLGCYKNSFADLLIHVNIDKWNCWWVTSLLQ